MTKKPKRHRKEDQGSSSEDMNTKCQDKEHKNVFENNLTQSN